MDIRPLTVADARAAVRLRRQALTTDSYAFAERVDTDAALDVEFVRDRLAASGIDGRDRARLTPVATVIGRRRPLRGWAPPNGTMRRGTAHRPAAVCRPTRA